MAKRKQELVELRLPMSTIRAIDLMAKEGIAGETAEEVIIFMLRSYLLYEHREAQARGNKQ